MSKNKTVKNEETTKTNLKDLLTNSTTIDLLICIIVILVLFIPTLNRPWLTYDERIIYDSLYFPVPKSFGEIFEIFGNFGSNFNIFSSNSIYSSNYISRACPLCLLMWTFTVFFLHKQAFLFHLLNLSLHILNTILIYFILKIPVSTTKIESPLKRFLPVLLTLIWAVHPVMIESVLLSTNFGATLSYSFFFGFLLDFLINKRRNNSLIRGFIIPIIFLIPMLTNEYIVTLPFVLFIISFYETYKNTSFKKAFKLSYEETKPYFVGLVVYTIFYFLFSNNKIIYSLIGNQPTALIERVFWLAPQIFIHFLKLIFYPQILSTDQTLFVHLGKILFDPYSILCILIFTCWLFIPLFLFIKDRKASNVFLLCWSFFFALLPFLHILMPSYLLAAERYLYCPLALLIFGFLKILLNQSNKKVLPVSSILLSVALLLCLSRSYYRALDWRDNYSFITSTYNSTSDPFLKAIKLNMLTETLSIAAPSQNEKLKEYYEDILKLLNEAKEANIKLQNEYQASIPLILKSYGLDYDSRLAKIASLEAFIKCIKLKEDYQIGINLLNPYINKPELLDPRIFEIYTSWLINDKKILEAKHILLKANSTYPHISSILMQLFDLSIKSENNKKKAEKYLIEALKYYPQDTSILGKAIIFYQEQKNSLLAARYSYLYGLLTQSRVAYQQALSNYLDSGDLRNAKKTVLKLLEIAPDDPETLYFISDYYYKTKNNEKAISYLTKAYSTGLRISASPKLMFNIGYTLTKLYLLLNNQEQAIILAKEIFNFTDSDNKSLIKLAKLYKSLDLKEDLNACLKKINLTL